MDRARGLRVSAGMKSPSRAGSLPQGHAVNCGSEPAREGISPANTGSGILHFTFIKLMGKAIDTAKVAKVAKVVVFQ